MLATVFIKMNYC